MSIACKIAKLRADGTALKEIESQVILECETITYIAEDEIDVYLMKDGSQVIVHRGDGGVIAETVAEQMGAAFGGAGDTLEWRTARERKSISCNVISHFHHIHTFEDLSRLNSHRNENFVVTKVEASG